MARKIDYAVTYRFSRDLLNKISNKAKSLNITKNALLIKILEKSLSNVSPIKDNDK